MKNLRPFNRLLIATGSFGRNLGHTPGRTLGLIPRQERNFYSFALALLTLIFSPIFSSPNTWAAKAVDLNATARNFPSRLTLSASDPKGLARALLSLAQKDHRQQEPGTTLDQYSKLAKQIWLLSRSSYLAQKEVFIREFDIAGGIGCTLAQTAIRSETSEIFSALLALKPENISCGGASILDKLKARPQAIVNLFKANPLYIPKDLLFLNDSASANAEAIFNSIMGTRLSKNDPFANDAKTAIRNSILAAREIIQNAKRNTDRNIASKNGKPGTSTTAGNAGL